MTLPPLLRQVQQSPWFQAVVLPASVIGGLTLYKCAGENFEHMGMACLLSALHAGVGAIVAYVVGTFQHSPGSASFLPTGEVNPVAVKAAAKAEAKP